MGEHGGKERRHAVEDRWLLALYECENRIIASGAGRSGSRIVVAPTDMGNDMALPKPYAKKIFAAE
jgi:hypothetical protein